MSAPRDFSLAIAYFLSHLGSRKGAVSGSITRFIRKAAKQWQAQQHSSLHPAAVLSTFARLRGGNAKRVNRPANKNFRPLGVLKKFNRLAKLTRKEDNANHNVSANTLEADPFGLFDEQIEQNASTAIKGQRIWNGTA